MPIKNQKTGYLVPCLIRKEHFGTLILLTEGRRFTVDNIYFPLLKSLSKGMPISNIKIGEKDTRLQQFILDCWKNEIFTTKPSSICPPTRIYAGKTISKDCLSYPRTVYWECTPKCNFRCLHCYAAREDSENCTEMPLKSVYKFIDALVKNGVEFLNIGGGEPLLYKHIFDTITYATNQGLNVEMTTNGFFLTPPVISKLVDAGLKYIQVSLDGGTTETYEKIRVGGIFRRVIGNIQHATQKLVVSVCTVVNRINQHEIQGIVDLCEKMGVKYYRIIPLMEVGRGKGIANKMLSRTQFRSLYSFIINRSKGRKKQTMKVSLNENLVVPTVKNIEWMPNNHYGCSAGRTTCGIDPAGNVYPCSYLTCSEMYCGNIQEEDLGKIWRNSRVLKKFRTISQLKGRCANCKYLPSCRGGCRAAAYLKTGSIYESDPICSVK